MIFDGKVYREPTEAEKAESQRRYEEIQKAEQNNPAPPTDAERLAALENQLAGIVSAYREGVNEA